MSNQQPSNPRQSLFSMREAFEILDWGKPANIKALLDGKDIPLDKAMLLYTHSVQKTLTHFTWYDKAPKDVARSVEMIDALSQLIARDVAVQALNTPTRYEMSLLERVCILHDDVAKMLVGALMRAGSDPLREEAFANAVHRCLEMGNVNTLRAMKEQGLVIVGEAAKKALECASSCNTHGLRSLVDDFGLDPATVLNDGGNILHHIARDHDVDQALSKIDYCSELPIGDIPNRQGIYATDVATRWGHSRVCTRLETYYSRQTRPFFPGVHPFAQAAQTLLDRKTAQYAEAAHYLKRAAQWGLQGEHRVFNRTGFGVGAIAIELGDVAMLLAAFLEGETVNSKAPEGASLLGYAAVLFERNESMRGVYANMFSILLKQPNIDWELYDQHGTTVRTWVEHSLLEKQVCFLDESARRMLEASERAKLISGYRF